MLRRKRAKYRFPTVPLIVLLGTGLAGVFIGCGVIKPSLTELSETDPAFLAAKQDSLLVAEKNNPELVSALTTAHVNLARKAQSTGDYGKAQSEFEAALKLDSKDNRARYGIAMLKGRRLFKKGSRNALWDAIEQFGKASMYDPTRGEPYYWMAKAYEKKDDQDFELILETYDKALALELPEKLKGDAEKSRAEVAKRKETFENFWK
ncbi:MAG: hypothetical protein GXO92_07160 [FCB group bacterium]|nr:hypothetical protein [FCB group bacterium]